jgi:hypothetical protein
MQREKIPICPMSEEARLIREKEQKIPAIHDCWCCARTHEKSPKETGTMINCTGWVWDQSSEA